MLKFPIYCRSFPHLTSNLSDVNMDNRTEKIMVRRQQFKMLDFEALCHSYSWREFFFILGIFVDFNIISHWPKTYKADQRIGSIMVITYYVFIMCNRILCIVLIWTDFICMKVGSNHCGLCFVVSHESWYIACFWTAQDPWPKFYANDPVAFGSMARTLLS